MYIRQQVDVGSGLGIKTAAVLSSMENPLGRTVGHAVEVSEAVNCLKGQGPDDLQHLVAELGKDIFPHGADPSLFLMS